MTSFILIVCGLAFGVICLGIGYLFGKKNKVIAQATSMVNEVTSKAEAVIDKTKEAVDVVKK